MFRMKLAIGMAVMCLVATAVRAEEENPFKKAKVGDWTQYAMKTVMAAATMESEMKQTVTKKTDTEVTYEVKMKANGMDMPAQTMTIKLDEKYDPTHAQKGATVKEIAKGDEKLTIGGKTINTHWVEVETSMKIGDKDVVSKSKVWMAPDSVPLGGLVKMENDAGGTGKTTMELKDFGSAK